MLAYVATGSSVIGGFYHYANLLFRHGAGRAASAVVLATIVTGISVWIAYGFVPRSCPTVCGKGKVDNREYPQQPMTTYNGLGGGKSPYLIEK